MVVQTVLSFAENAVWYSCSSDYTVDEPLRSHVCRARTGSRSVESTELEPSVLVPVAAKNRGCPTRHSGPHCPICGMTRLRAGLTSEVPSCSGTLRSSSSSQKTAQAPLCWRACLMTPDGRSFCSRLVFLNPVALFKNKNHWNSYIYINSSLFQITIFIRSSIVGRVFPIYRLNFSCSVDI